MRCGCGVKLHRHAWDRLGRQTRLVQVKLALALSAEAASPMPRQVGGLGNSMKVLHAKNPATRNRTRDHLISATLYSQMLYQLSYSRLCLLLSPNELQPLTIHHGDKSASAFKSESVEDDADAKAADVLRILLQLWHPLFS